MSEDRPAFLSGEALSGEVPFGEPSAGDLPLISCIVPVHNGAAFLAEALDSIFSQAFSQTRATLEVIVVDDGSADASAAVAAGYRAVRLHRQQQAGVAAARNAGLGLARGDFIAFLDADDLWLPGKLEAQLQQLQACPQAGCCLTMVRHLPLQHPLLSGESPAVAGTPLLDDQPRPGRLMQCLLARRQVFDLVGLFDTGTRTRADQDWFVRAADLGVQETMVPEVLVLRRLHDSNHSLDRDSKVADDFLTIVQRTLQRRRREGIPLRPVDKWTV